MKKYGLNRMCMSSNVYCPNCGFPANPLCSNDGENWKYVCPRCHAIFWA